MRTYSKLSLLAILLIAGNIISCSKKDDPIPPLADIDGNVFHTIKIGTQVWMVENLKVTKYNDGTAIPIVTGFSEWGSQSTGAYCWYDNDIQYKNAYGALYNWYTVNTGKLCPPGWHVPNDSEWNTLINYIGVSNAGKLKEAGTTHWQTPNTGGTNESGFTALPSGFRSIDGSFNYVGSWCYWWSLSENGSGGAGNKGLGSAYGDTWFGNNNSKVMGYAVRCIKD